MNEGALGQGASQRDIALKSRARSKCFQPAFDLYLGGSAGPPVTACFIVKILRIRAEEVV